MLPGTLPCGARTFLRTPRGVRRLSGQLPTTSVGLSEGCRKLLCRNFFRERCFGTSRPAFLSTLPTDEVQPVTLLVKFTAYLERCPIESIFLFASDFRREGYSTLHGELRQ